MANQQRKHIPDYEYWAMCAYLSPDEATALSLGDDPRHYLNEDPSQMFMGEPLSMERREFRDRRRLIERLTGALPGVSPAALVDWMTSHRVDVPEVFRIAVSANRGASDESAETRLKEIEAELAEAKSALEACRKENESLIAAANMEKRKTLDRIAVGMTIEMFGWQPEDPERQDYATQVAEALRTLADDEAVSSDPKRAWRRELRVHKDTVRTQLNKALDRLQE